MLQSPPAMECVVGYRTGLKNVCTCADLGAENPEICFEPSILYSVVYLRLLEEKPRFWSIKTRSDKTSAAEA